MDKVPQSVLMTWIYNNHQRSTLSAVLLHLRVNLVGELFHLTLRSEGIYIALWIIASIGVAILWGGKRLAVKAGALGRDRRMISDGLEPFFAGYAC
jgi:hypothetical protein